MRSRSALFSFAYSLAAIVALSMPAGAQAPAKPAAIDSGMTKAQVIERFGKAAAERSRGEFTFLFFSNGMEKQVGMSDIVILQSDRVVDAVLRSPSRTYTGSSSSPKAISGQDARKKAPPPKGRGGTR
jgi:hypothetical protein